MTTLTNISAFVDSAVRHYDAKVTAFLNKQEAKTLNNTNWVLRTSSRSDVEGMASRARLDALDIALRSMDVERSEMQIRFHNAFTQASLRFICRDDPSANLEEIMKQKGWTNTKQQVLCLTPRRFGKTYAVAMFAAAILVTIPGSEQAIFSTGRRASQKMLETIHMFVVALKKILEITDLKCLKFNQEMLVYETPEDTARGVRRAIYSYPSNAKTLRGVGGDILFLEEAAFMSMDVFYEIVTPLLEMQTTSLIAISTPQDSTNFYSELFELKDEKGEALFNTIQISLICDKCKQSDHPETCTHRSHLLPPWKSKAKLAMVRSIYGEQTGLLQRESLGVITQDSRSVFPEDRITAIFSRVTNPPSDFEPRYVYTSCDPTGGGQSRMCLVSFLLYQGAVYIISLDSKIARNSDEVRENLFAHINITKRRFPRSTIFFMCESNMGQEASHIYSMLRSFSNIDYANDKNREGVMTTQERKELYILELQRYTMTESIYLADSISERGLKLLKKEMLQFKRIVVENHRVRSKFYYTGKDKGQDDTVMATSMGLWWAMEHLKTNS